MENANITFSSEERKTRRLRVLKRGVLAFAGQFAAHKCIVRDISDIGARLELDNTLLLPPAFTLHIEIDGFKVDCEMIWHHPPHVGVVFTSEKKSSTLARKQVLGDSQNALSEQFQKDFTNREALAGKAAKNLDKPGRKTSKPFGKRKFEG